MAQRHMKRRSSGLMSWLLVLLIAAGIFGLVKMRTGIISLEYAIGELETRKAAVMRQNKQLVAEQEVLRSIQQVDNRGLGLGFPEQGSVVYVKRTPEGGARVASLGDPGAGGDTFKSTVQRLQKVR